MKTRLPSLVLLLTALLPGTAVVAQQAPSAREIVRKAEQHLRGETSISEMSMRIVRPDWERTLEMKTWTRGNDYTMVLITAPARDRGTAYLMRGNEVWNWLPNVNRIVKLPPSMMSQSWMGSDFTNDDLVKESSIVEDYTHEILGDTTIAGREAWKLKLTPRPDAAIVWSKVHLYVTREHHLQMKVVYFNEQGNAENIMKMSEVRRMGGRLIPSRMVMVPADEPEKQTILHYESLQFNEEIPEGFFSKQRMKRLRP